MCLYTFLSTFIFSGTVPPYRSSDPQRKFILDASYLLLTRTRGNQSDLKRFSGIFQIFGISLFHLIPKRNGYFPINYFTRLKIQKACQYIELTDMKLNEIAMRLGFEEQAYFSRVFTKVMGISPSSYRKKRSR